ncbi:unnamed protein product [Rhizophagus irregularis]|nr:unnamed protein product [Rhizophagus irregularis]
MSTQPQSLDQLIIPENMRKTLNGSDFLIKDLTIGEEKVLIFTTTSNIKYLAQSNFGSRMELSKQFQQFLDNCIQYMEVLEAMKIHE